MCFAPTANHIKVTGSGIVSYLWIKLVGIYIMLLKEHKLTNTNYRLRQIVHPMPVGRAWGRKTSEARPIFRVRKFCLVEKKKSLDLHIYSRIGETIKKLHWNLQVTWLKLQSLTRGVTLLRFQWIYLKRMADYLMIY